MTQANTAALPLDRDAIAALDTATLYELIRLMTVEVNGREVETLAEQVRAELAEDEESAGWRDNAHTVLFFTDHWDNGWFYTGSFAVVIHGDDSRERYSFGGETDETLTALSREPRDAAGLDQYGVLKLNLASGDVEHTSTLAGAAD